MRVIRELTLQEEELICDCHKHDMEKEEQCPEPCDIYEDCLLCPNYMTVGGCGEA